MTREPFKKFAVDLLEGAGIEVNGSRPWDIQVHNEQFYGRVLKTGSLGLGESYMDGWWDAERVDEFIARLLTAGLSGKIKSDLGTVMRYAGAVLFNRQRKSKAFEVGERHYDIGNDVYEAMLDKRLVYTCAYWKEADTLDAAQEAKLDLVCRKVGLEKGMRVLDIGCGWGSFAKFAAQMYGAEVVGVTVSKEQVALGKKLCEGLPVELRLEDYRDTTGSFDRIVSLGMFEHVGYKNYGVFMKKARSLLTDDGLFLLHTIGGNVSNTTGDPWADRYIFPGGMVPSAAQISKAVEGQFVMEDWHNFGLDYDKTLMAWHANFEAAWPQLQERYDERFYRMWRYYLLSFAAAFRVRKVQLWQIVLSPHGVPGGYESVR